MLSRFRKSDIEIKMRVNKILPCPINRVVEIQLSNKELEKLVDWKAKRIDADQFVYVELKTVELNKLL